MRRYIAYNLSLHIINPKRELVRFGIKNLKKARVKIKNKPYSRETVKLYLETITYCNSGITNEIELVWQCFKIVSKPHANNHLYDLLRFTKFTDLRFLAVSYDVLLYKRPVKSFRKITKWKLKLMLNFQTSISGKYSFNLIIHDICCQWLKSFHNL